jgi:hypothetical protein
MITRAKAHELRKLIEKASVSLDDEDALNGVELYPEWKVDTDYTEDKDRVRDEDVLYKCRQSHRSQADWKPSITPALWKVVTLDEWPEWVQPTGAHDAYDFGAKVSHNDKHWISTMDANVFEPGVAGWQEA